MLSGPAANPVLIGSHHARAELVQNAEGGLISRQPKLPLKLHRRHALRLAGNQISRPEPNAQRRMAALHHGSHGQSRVATAMAASQNAGTIFKAERFPNRPAVRADEPLAPTGLFQVGGTGRIIRKKPLELGERFREWQIGAGENVHGQRPVSALRPRSNSPICGCQPDSAARRPYGSRPQEVINSAIVDKCDLLVGIFWTRIGSPSGEADSGTIEEIELVAKAKKP